MTETREALPTLTYYPGGSARLRTFSLFYFASLISIWTILGHTVLGFEQSWAQPVVGIGTAAIVQLLLDWVDARARGRAPRYTEGLTPFLTLLAPAVISGAAISMLLYPNRLLLPLAFASALAISSKVMFRAPVGPATQHIYNPSNFGITVTLFLCPWVGVAPPYHFTENVEGVWNWVIPGVILATGIFLHTISTKRLPLIFSWLLGFVAQGFARHFLFGVPWITPLVPMTSAAFVLFTLYMIPDPATTPIEKKGQIAFGFLVAAVYGMLQVMHEVYGLFVALTIVSTVRGIGLYVLDFTRRGKRTEPGA